jgi:hypothetical protein
VLHPLIDVWASESHRKYELRLGNEEAGESIARQWEPRQLGRKRGRLNWEMNEMSALIIFAVQHRVGSGVENGNMVPEKDPSVC